MFRIKCSLNQSCNKSTSQLVLELESSETLCGTGTFVIIVSGEDAQTRITSIYFPLLRRHWGSNTSESGRKARWVTCNVVDCTLYTFQNKAI